MRKLFALALLLLAVSGTAQQGMGPGPGVKSYSGGGGDALFILSQTLGTPRSDFTGCVGMAFTSPGGSITVTELCRMRLSGNSGTHDVDITQAGSGVLGTVSIDMSSGTLDAYKCVALGSPVVLDPSTQYFVLSHETNGGDTWYDNDTTVDSVTSAFGTHDGSALETGGCGTGVYNNNTGAPAAYVPTNFKAH